MKTGCLPQLPGSARHVLNESATCVTAEGFLAPREQHVRMSAAHPQVRRPLPHAHPFLALRRLVREQHGPAVRLRYDAHSPKLHARADLFTTKCGPVVAQRALTARPANSTTVTQQAAPGARLPGAHEQTRIAALHTARALQQLEHTPLTSWATPPRKLASERRPRRAP